MRTLKVPDILNGELGRDVWGSEQTLLAMQNKKNHDGSEYILLRAQVELSKNAKASEAPLPRIRSCNSSAQEITVWETESQ